MNPNKQRKSFTIYECSVCGAKTTNKKDAEKCCTNFVCPTCGKILDKKFSSARSYEYARPCEKCSQQRDIDILLDSISKSEKIPLDEYNGKYLLLIYNKYDPNGLIVENDSHLKEYLDDIPNELRFAKQVGQFQFGMDIESIQETVADFGVDNYGFEDYDFLEPMNEKEKETLQGWIDRQPCFFECIEGPLIDLREIA